MDKIGRKLLSGRVKLTHLPLHTLTTSEGAVDWYSPPHPALVPSSGFDLVIVDGPTGTRHLSRYGIAEYTPEWMAPEWMLLWDDLDREADLDSFGRLVEKLRRRGVSHDHLLLDGDRTVGLILTPAFQFMRYQW